MHLTDGEADGKLKEITERMISGQKGISRYVPSGVATYVAYAPIPGSHWSLGIKVPEKEFLTKLTPFAMVSLISIGVILILTCGLGILASRRLSRPIITLNQAVEKMAQGDLTVQTIRVFDSDRDELGTLTSNFNLMVVNLRNLVQRISSSAERVAASSEQLNASAGQSAQANSQVADSITQVASAAAAQLKAADSASGVVEQMSSNIQQVAAHAGSVAATAEKTSNAAKTGEKTVEQANEQMIHIEKAVTNSAEIVANLGGRSKEIGQIVDTISGIAGQTNLLALNAAIEAARAGEQGRGFAVVAEEVRNLAEQSQEAAKHIAVLIGEIQEDTQNAVSAMSDGTQEVKRGTEVVNSAGKAFLEITGLIETVSGQVSDIAAAIQQMVSDSQQLVASVKDIDNLSQGIAGQTQTVSAATEEQTASMEEIASSSHELAQMAEELQSAVAKFRVV